MKNMQEEFDQKELDSFVEDFDEWATPINAEEREQASNELDKLCAQVGLKIEAVQF